MISHSEQRADRCHRQAKLCLNSSICKRWRTVISFGHDHAGKCAAYQANSAEEVIIEAHQVDLAHCCQSLLLWELAGACMQPQALCSHTHSTAADNDHPAARFYPFINAVIPLSSTCVGDMTAQGYLSVCSMPRTRRCS